MNLFGIAHREFEFIGERTLIAMGSLLRRDDSPRASEARPMPYRARSGTTIRSDSALKPQTIEFQPIEFKESKVVSPFRK